MRIHILRKTNFARRQALVHLVAVLCIAGALFAGQAQAVLINFDLTSSTGGDAYNTGPVVFGTASSQWNERSRLLSASNLALIDDTGAASPITVTYTRNGSGTITPGVLSGTYQNLGYSHIATGTVTLSGLAAGTAYDLAIFSAWDGSPSWTVGGLTESSTQSLDWSSLTEGVQYVLFEDVIADGAGTIQFTPNPNPTGLSGASLWSAFQLLSVPEPGTLALFGTGMVISLASRRRKAA